MIRSYLKLAIRNLNRQKVYSFINIIGLSIGMAASILIFLWVQDELKYDKYNVKGQNTYRLLDKEDGTISASRQGVMLPFLLKEIPEIEKGLRISKEKAVIAYKNKAFNEENIIFADSVFFNFFNWELSYGNPATVLCEPNSMVISQKMAKKYFGAENPVGKILRYDNFFDFIVTGVMKTPPEHSHFSSDFVCSILSQKKINKSTLESWMNYATYIYLQLNDNTKIHLVEAKIKKTIIKVSNDKDYKNVNFILQPLFDIHIYSSNVKDDINSHGNIANVYNFSAIAALILLIACFNFINLSLARSVKRAKEVGVRKTIGATRKQIICQFLSESFVFTIIAVTLALILIEISLPWFNNFLDKHIDLILFSDNIKIFILIIFIFFVTVISGLYPAFVLSKYNPVKVLKGGINNPQNKKNFRFRLTQILVIFQFSVSIGLIIIMTFMYSQMNYVGNKNLGMDTDCLLTIENPWGSTMNKRYKNFKNLLISSPYIKLISASHNVPSHKYNNYSGSVGFKGETKKQGKSMAITSVDYDFFDVLDAKFLKGRNFSKKYATDENNACILNEAAVKELGIENPLGKNIEGLFTEKNKKVIGVIKNIHYQSLHEKVIPAVYYISKNEYPQYCTNIVLKIDKDNIPAAMDYIKKSWKEIAPQWPISYYFVNSRFQNLYKSDNQTTNIINIFTALAIFISLLGLFGLVLFVVEGKTKEIGIRKVLGASVIQIISKLSKEFAILVIIANIISWPAAYFIIKQWLMNFAFHIDINLWVFIFSGIIGLLLALIVISFQSYKFANKNPVDALKYE